MSKKTLSKAILDNTNIRVRDADALAGILLEEIRSGIASGGLKLPGIGSFSVVKRAERVGTNPKTKRPYKTPERKAVRFKVSPALMNLLNQNKGK